MLAMPQGLWPAMCLDPPAASQTVAAAIEAGGVAARAAAEAATVGARQCCGSTLVTLSRALGRLGIQRAAVNRDGNLGGQGVGRHAARGMPATPCQAMCHAAPCHAEVTHWTVQCSRTMMSQPQLPPCLTPPLPAEAAAASPSFIKALGDEIKGSGLSLPDCAAPMGLDQELGIADTSAHVGCAVLLCCCDGGRG